jgi:hypothetical protein
MARPRGAGKNADAAQAMIRDVIAPHEAQTSSPGAAMAQRRATKG